MKKIRLGMIGGGPDSMIGNVHRHAAMMDNQYELIGGAFSQTKAKSITVAEQWHLNKERIYEDANKMLDQEKLLPDHQRMQAISIITPNHTHFHLAKAALRAGFHVIIEKPITITSIEAIELQDIAIEKQKQICVTYVYAGYPMLIEMQQMIRDKVIGKVKKVHIEFQQGWLSAAKEKTDNKQAQWRMDPNMNVAGTLVDIGSHAFYLAEFLTGLKVQRLCAHMFKHIEQRELDDDNIIVLDFDHGVNGLIHVSQIAAGHNANLTINIIGDAGSVKWQHTQPNELVLVKEDAPQVILQLGNNKPYLSPTTRELARTPAGHPEGYLEAFANIYRGFANALRNKDGFKQYPTVTDAIRSLLCIETALQNQPQWSALSTR